VKRVMSTIAAAALVAIGVSACGAGEPEEPTTVTTTVAPSTSSDEQESKTSSTSSTSSSATSATPSESSSTSTSTTSAPQESSSTTEDEGGDAGAATTITTVWVDDSWTMEGPGTDVCEMGGLYGSNYSRQDDVFTCGPTAASALACKNDDGTTTCITNALGRQAIRFDSPTADSEDVTPREGEAIPLYVELEDDAMCETISHDHDQHWGGKFSWYRCKDGSELLTDQEIGATFDTGSPAWTVQRSVHKGQPETVRVETAAYAGT